MSTTKEPTIAVELPDGGAIELKPSHMTNYQLAALLRCSPDGDGELQAAMWEELLRRLRTGEQGPAATTPGLDDDTFREVMALDERDFREVLALEERDETIVDMGRIRRLRTDNKEPSGRGFFKSIPRPRISVVYDGERDGWGPLGGGADRDEQRGDV
jgi:hypothetical protein